MRGSTFILAAAVTALLGGCSRPAPVDVPALDAAAHAFQWPAWGGDAGGSRFAPLAQITPANVAALTPAWTFHTGALAKGWASGEKLTFEATPLFVDGTLYFSTATGQVFALDAASGKARWRYDAGIDPKAYYSELSSRGVSYWRDPQAAAGGACAARIFVATLDARLIALDASTGTPCEGFGTHGQLHLSAHLRDSSKGDYAFTSPAAIDGDTVILGSSIGDNYSAANALGVVRALEQTDYASLKGGNDVYISVLGMMLPRIPESLALPFAILVFLGIGLAAWLARREPFAWKPALLAALMPLALIAGCVAMGFITAEIAKLISGQPDPAYAYPIAMRLALGFGAFGMALLVSRMASLRGAVSAAWLWMAALGIVTAALLPGISPYFTFPSFIAAILLLATSRTKSGWNGTVGQIAVALSALGAMIVWIALVCSGETLMGLSLHPLFTVPAAFGLMTVVPLLVARPMPRASWAMTTVVFTIVSLGCAVLMGLHPAYSAASPQRVNILYFAKGQDKPYWIAASAWKAKGTEPVPVSMQKAGGFTYKEDAYGGLGMGSAYVAPANGTPTFQMPSATVVSDAKSGSTRTVHIAVHGSPDTSAMLFRIPKDAKLTGFAMRGQHYDPPAGWSGDTMVECSSPDCRDMDVMLTLGSTAPLTFDFAEQRYGLPAWGDAVKATRPKIAFPSQSGDGIILANDVKVP